MLVPTGSADGEARLGQTVDRYRLEAVLGAGGFGSVYQARHVVMDRAVALKLLHRELARDDGVRERFLREARILAGLQHPNVVGVHDCGVTSDGELFLAMELLTGEDLASRLCRVGRLDVASVLEVVASLLEGLSAVHDAGVVHRDLKPANIFRAREGVTERPKLLDFGISKHRDGGRVTRTGTLLGTPVYMAPEAIAIGTAAVDARADLYAVGVMLFEMLSGRLPYEAPSYEGLVVKIATEAPPPLASVAGVSPELAAIVDRALARDPAARFGDARAMRRAVAQVRERRVTGAVAQAETMVAANTPRGRSDDQGASFVTNRTLLATPVEGRTLGGSTPAARPVAAEAMLTPTIAPVVASTPTGPLAYVGATPLVMPLPPSAVGQPSTGRVAHGRLPWGWIAFAFALVATTTIVGVASVFLRTHQERSKPPGPTVAAGPSTVVTPPGAPSRVAAMPSTDHASVGSGPATEAKPPPSPEIPSPSVGARLPYLDRKPPDDDVLAQDTAATDRGTGPPGREGQGSISSSPRLQGRAIRWREPEIVGPLDAVGVVAMLEARRGVLERCRGARDSVARAQLLIGDGRVNLATSNVDGTAFDPEASRCVANVLQRQRSLAGEAGIATVVLELAAREP